MKKPYDIFISYSSLDKVTAFDICDYLESNGIACWIAPRDVTAGNDYSAEIVNSIKICKVFILVLTQNANSSKHVANEVDLVFNNSKTIIPFKIGDFNLSDTLEYYLSKYHRINAGNKHKEFYLELLKNCKNVLGIDNEVKETKSINATIQMTDRQDIIVNINGKEQNIPNTLENLKNLLESNDTHFFLFYNKVYNINELNEGSFGLLSGTIAFNQFLTKNLIDSIRSESLPAHRFCEKVTNIPNWETEPRIGDKAKEIIAYSFVGIIGKELGKLMAIGKEDFSEIKQRKYVEKCITIVKRCLDLVNYALLSELWDRSQENELIYNETEQKALNQKFDSPFEQQINEQLILLYHLVDIFSNPQNKIELPIPEIKNILINSESKADLEHVCENIQKLQGNNPDVIDCYYAEKNLASFFKHFSFLTLYQMASVKRIGFRQIKNYSPGYIHRYIALGIDNKANIDAEKVDYDQDTTYSDSVLLYKGENFKKSINLFPFVIDYNAITFEQGSKICFFRSMPIEGNCLEYVFLEDNSFIKFEKKGVFDQQKNLNELLINNENMKILNIECVVDRFKEARRSILCEICFEDL
jgi:hypothetical protein